jgi:activator of 2-hydroxyglutaryl-CoA dehydratase
VSKIVFGIDVGKETLSLALLKNESFCCKTVNNSEAGFRELERRIIRSEEINKKIDRPNNFHNRPDADLAIKCCSFRGRTG